jgi:hypothetical protein
MPLFIVTVTEAPKVEQRKPRVYEFVLDAADEADAAVKWQADKYSGLFGALPGDKTEFQLGDGRPYPISR